MYLCYVKRCAVILIAFLSLLVSGRGLSATEATYCERVAGSRTAVANAPESEKPTDHALHKDMCITAAQGWSFSGSENSNTVLLRTSQTGRRTTQSTKTTSRLVRTGKIIDTHNFNPFLSALFPKADGAQSFFRYIYSICCLRL